MQGDSSKDIDVTVELTALTLLSVLARYRVDLGSPATERENAAIEDAFVRIREALLELKLQRMFGSYGLSELKHRGRIQEYCLKVRNESNLCAKYDIAKSYTTFCALQYKHEGPCRQENLLVDEKGERVYE
jgi:hypothetical protein